MDWPLRKLVLFEFRHMNGHRIGSRYIANDLGVSIGAVERELRRLQRAGQVFRAGTVVVGEFRCRCWRRPAEWGGSWHGANP